MQSQAQKDRVEREQQLVKEKGREALEAARRLKEGKVDVELPSTEKVTEALEKGEESLERFQSSDRGQQLGREGQKIIEDVKKVLEDEKELIQTKNEGDLLQSIVRDIWSLLQELSTDSELKELFYEWQEDLLSLMSSGDFIHFFQQSGELFTSMRDTEEFLELLSQLIDLTKVVVAEQTELATSQDPVALREFRREKELNKRRVENELRAILRALSYNDLWRVLVHKSKEIGHEAKEAAEETKDKVQQAFYRIRDIRSFQQLVDDFKTFLQRLVGDKRSVDEFFNASKAAFDEIVNDRELHCLIDEFQTKLSLLAQNPELLDDKATIEDLRRLADKAECALKKFRESKAVLRTKEEAKLIIQEIKHDEETSRLIKDLRKLWDDISSDRPGEIVDADVLKSIRQLIVPLLLEHLNNVPLPGFTDTAEFLGKYSYTVEDMKISLPELIPENIHARFEFEMDTNPLALETTNQHTYLYLQASNIQLHLHDAKFSYSRLTIPKHSDSGIFDVDTSGNGMTIWMKMEIKTDTEGGKNKQVVTVLKSNVRIHRLNITFKESKHDTLYEFLMHLFQNRIKNRVIELIQEKLKLFGGFFSEQLLLLIDQARAKSDEFARLAKAKSEEAKKQLESLKDKAKDKLEESKDKLQDFKDKASDKADQFKDETKADLKPIKDNLIERAGEKAQEALDSTKRKIEEQKREKEFDRSFERLATDPIIPARPLTHSSTDPLIGSSTFNKDEPLFLNKPKSSQQSL